MPEIFVNRDGAKAWFADAVRAIPDDGVSLKVFTGLGGQGKTALCDELYRRASSEDGFDAYNRDLKCARVSFANIANRTDPLAVMIQIRNGFAVQGLSLPGFDLALAFVWEQTRPHDTPPVLKQAWLAKSKDVFADGVVDTVAAAREVLQEEVRKIPFLDTVLRRIAHWSIDKVKFEYLIRERSYIGDFFSNGELKNDHELGEALYAILAKDLARAMEGDDRLALVLFLDEYEGLFSGAADAHQDQPVDRAVRRFVEDASRLLIVFFSREPLPWAKTSPFWSIADSDHYDITGLERSYAEEWLTEAGVYDESIRTAMLEACVVEERGEQRVYPLLLDMQVDHYRKTRERGRPVAAADFELAQGELDYKLRDLLGRVLKDHNDRSFQQTFEILALAERFDRETVDFVVERFKTYFPGDGYAFLAGLSFIEADDNGFLSVHKKIAEVSRRLMNDDPRKKAEAALIDHFLERGKVAQPIEMTDEKALFIIEAANIKKRQGAEGYVAWLLPWGLMLNSAARFKVGESLWRDALVMCRSAFGENHKDTAVSYSEVASNLDNQGRYHEAELLHENALEIRRCILGEMHVNTGESYNDLATNATFQGRYLEALRLRKNVMQINSRVFEEQYDSFEKVAKDLKNAAMQMGRAIITMNDTAYNLKLLGFYSKAAELYEKALTQCKLLFGEDHPQTALCYNNIAANLDAQGHYRQAEPLYRKALRIFKRFFGENHPKTAGGYNNLGANLNDQGRYKEAKPLHKKALRIRRRILGEWHPHTSDSHNNLAFTLAHLRQYAAAESHHQKAIKIAKLSLGDGHPTTIAASENLRLFWTRLGQ